MAGTFEITDTPLAGLKIIRRRPVPDSRGFFCRVFCAAELAAAGFTRPVSQANHTFTRKQGSVRGLHYQLQPAAEMKLVSCLKGEIFDVAVDVRRGSPTFLRWHGVRLAAGGFASLLVPEGFAHGYQALAPDSEVLYLNSSPYSPEHARALNALDPALAVGWPLPVSEQSERDRAVAFCGAGFEGMVV